MKKKLSIQKITILILFSISVSLVIYYMVLITGNSNEKTDEKQVEEVEVSGENRVSFSLMGDIIIHDSVMENAMTDTSYDFKPFFELVTPYFESDIVYANFEGMASESFDYTGYPAFNAPPQIIDDLVSLGFNMFSISSNHSLDYGTQAVSDTNAYFTTNYPDVVVSGYNESCALFEVDTFEENGIEFSYVSFTDIVNIPEAVSDCNINYTGNDYFEDQITQAASVGDVNIISMHYGIENESILTDIDSQMEKMLLDAGFEIIIGTHPHVVKPIKLTQNADGNDALVVYSLGNFLSTQLEEAQRLGLILQFDVVMDETGHIDIENIVDTPTYMYYDWGDSGYVYAPGDDPTADLLASRGNLKIVPVDQLDSYTSQEHEDSVNAMYTELKNASVIEGNYEN